MDGRTDRWADRRMAQFPNKTNVRNIRFETMVPLKFL